jgi:glycosyltransferase involved in cell wall biosynthesis
MKILHCVSSLKVGGAEKLVKNLSLAQSASDQEVAILSFGKENEEFQALLKKAKVKVYNISGRLFARQMQIIKLVSQFNVIHIHSPAVIRAFLFVSPYLIKKQVIYTIHGEVSPNLTGMKLSHRIARYYVNHTFAVSEKTRLKAKALFSWPKDKIIVINNGVSIASLINNKTSKSKVVVGTVSRLIPLKKIEDLIQCVHTFNLSEHLAVKIFGDGPEKQTLEALVKELELRDCIQFMGNVIDESIIYSSIDCLVICSETEGLPMVLLESMAHGVPCISTQVGAIPDVINAGDSGFLYDVGNLEQLAHYLKIICSDKNLLAQKGLNGKNYVTQHYSIDRIAKEYQQYYGKKS